MWRGGCWLSSYGIFSVVYVLPSFLSSLFANFGIYLKVSRSIIWSIYARLTVLLITELSRIPSHTHKIHNAYLTSFTSNSNLHCRSRMWISSTHPHVRSRDVLPVSNLRRPNQETLLRPRHVEDFELRYQEARISA